MTSTTSSNVRIVARYVAVAGAAVLLTLALLPLREQLTLVNSALIYLLFAVVVAGLGGLWLGLFASLLANVALDFVFVPPVFQFTPTKSEDLVALAVFLLIGVASSTFIARSSGRAAAAVLRAGESRLLYELSTLVISELGAETTLSSICARVHETFHASSAAIVVRVDGAWVVSAAQPASSALVLTEVDRGALDRAMAQRQDDVRYDATIVRSGHWWQRDDRGNATVCVPMMIGGEVVGVLRAAGIAMSASDRGATERLLHAFAQVGGLAIRHAFLMGQATESRALQQADTLKSALLASVSHELRSPLGAIKAAATGLMDHEREWSEEERGELLSAIDEEADRLTALVANFLQLSRIEGGALHQTRDWYDVREFLETVTNRMQDVTATHRLVVRIDADVAQAYFDYVQMGQAISNLVENAAKFSQSDSAITIDAARQGHAVVLTVRDRGVGVPPAESARIFDRFYRGTNTGMTRGTGLGLTITRGIVEAHSGSIRVEAAEDGIGSAFVVTLPVPETTPPVREDES